MLTPEGSKDKMAVAVLGWDRAVLGWDRVVLGWDRAVFLDSWISPAPLAIFNKLCEILDWILDI